MEGLQWCYPSTIFSPKGVLFNTQNGAKIESKWSKSLW